MPKPLTAERAIHQIPAVLQLRTLLMSGVAVVSMSLTAASATTPPSLSESGLMFLMQQDDDGDDDGGAGGGDDDGAGGGDDGGAGGGGDDGGAGGGGDDGGAGGGDDGGAGGGDDDGAGGDDGGGAAGDDDDGVGGGPGGGDDDDEAPGGDNDDDAPTTGGARASDDPIRVSRDETARETEEFRDERGYRAKADEVLLIEPTDASLAASRNMGFTVVRTIRLPEIGVSAVVLKTPRRMSTIQALRRIRKKDPSGRYDYNHLYDFRPTLELKSPYQPGLEEAPRRTLSNQADISIGIIDTAVYADHPVLKGARIEQRTFHKTGGGARADHGTAVVSVLADNRDGLLPKSRLFVAGVFGTAKQGDPVSSVIELANAIDWLVERDAAVINMSLAGPPNALLEAAVQRALAKGHAIVAAVGNAGPNSKPLYPAAYPGVIGVTATDNRKQIFRRAVQGSQVDFAAPGVAVRAADGSGASESLYSGTSFATPYVAAYVAIGLKRPNAAQSASAVQALIARAKDLGVPGRDDTYGYGLIEP